MERRNNKMVSRESGNHVVWTSEKNSKFKLSEFRKPVLEWLKQNPSIIEPQSQYNAIIDMLSNEDDNNTIKDISVSRLASQVSWGIPVPGDAKHVVYVWLDALTNYLTVTGYPWQSPQNMAASGWPALVHIVGKDILKFHAIYWPAFLMAAGLPLPQKIISHGHWLYGHRKMSKSLGNVVKPHEMMDKYGVDPVRYYLLRDGNIRADSDFSEESLEYRYNELASKLGNLVMRSSAKKINSDATIPSKLNQSSPLTAQEKDVIGYIQSTVPLFERKFNNFDIAGALEAAISIPETLNKYWSDVEPWIIAKKAKSDEEAKNKLQNILFITYEALRMCGLMLQPVMPSKADEILSLLRVDESERNWDTCIFGYSLKHRTTSAPLKIGATQLFPRIE